MRKLLVCFLAVVFSLISVHDIYAGGLSTSGQGSRALSMGGAFTSVADDGSSIYYNPAGMTQINGSSVEATLTFVFPEIKYEMPSSASQKSTKNCIGPSLFLTHNFNNGLSAGLGIYSPYARDARYGADLAHGFPHQRAKLVRIDISPVIAYKINDNFSLGIGLIAGNGLLDQSIPVGPMLRIYDKAEGWGFGGIVGILWTINRNIKLGATYRTKMDIDVEGHRTLDIAGFETKSNSSLEIRYPSSVGLGASIMPTEKLTISLDADWYDWSYMDKMVTKTELWPDSSINLNTRDSWDFRLGGEYKLDQGVAVRAGYAYMQRAFPISHICPSKPDGNGHEFDIGIGKNWGHWKIDLNYEYFFTEKETTSENIFGYNGEYSITGNLIGFQVGYKW